MKKILLSLSFGLLASFANAATINVSGGGSALQNAINSAVAGDVLLVAPGTYSPIDTNNKAIRIEGTGSVAATIINGNGTQRCAMLGYGTATILNGFTLKNGNVSSGSGGGSSGGTLNNCILMDNNALDGGGAYNGTLNNCILKGNVANSSINPYGGGSYSCTLNNCLLTGNTAACGGGSYGGTLKNCTLAGNLGTLQINSGGGSYNGTLYNCIIWDNKNYSGAMNTLDAIQNPDATTSYLKAVVGARTNNANTVVSNLRQSVSLDRSMAKKALNDMEFVKFATNAQFLNIVK